MGNLEFQITIERLTDGSSTALVDLKGSIDGTTVKHFESETLGLFEKGVKFLILNFAQVGYMNSTGLGILVKVLDKYQEKDGDVKLVRVPRKVADLFEMLGISSILTIYESTNEAIDSLPAKLVPSSPHPQDPKAATSKAFPGAVSSAPKPKESLEIEMEPPADGGIVIEEFPGDDLGQGFLIDADSSIPMEQSPPPIPARPVPPPPSSFSDFGVQEETSEGITIGGDWDLAGVPQTSAPKSKSQQGQWPQSVEVGDGMDAIAGFDLSSPGEDKEIVQESFDLTAEEAPQESFSPPVMEEIQESFDLSAGGEMNVVQESFDLTATPEEAPLAENSFDLSGGLEEIPAAQTSFDLTTGEEIQESLDFSMDDRPSPPPIESSATELTDSEFTAFATEIPDKNVEEVQDFFGGDKKADAMFDQPVQDSQASEFFKEKEEIDEITEEIVEQANEQFSRELSKPDDSLEQEIEEIEDMDMDVPSESAEKSSVEKADREMEENLPEEKKIASENLMDADADEQKEMQPSEPSLGDFLQAGGTEALHVSHREKEAVLSAPSSQPFSSPEREKKEKPILQAPAPAPAPSTAVKGPEVLKRKTTVRYYEKMNPSKSFPLSVMLSREAIAAVNLPHVAQKQGQKVVEVKREKPEITITPCLPGCLLTPASVTLDVTPEVATAEFWVTPIIEGEIAGWIDIQYGGKPVEKIPLKTTSAKQTWAKVGATGAVLSPVLSYLIDGLKLDQEALQGVPHLLTFIQDSIGLLLFGALCMVPFILAGVLFYMKNKPKEAEILERFFSTEPK